MAKRKLTKNQIEWDKQIKRIERLVSTASERGYIFDLNSVYPEKPKRITQTKLKELKSIRGEKIYNYAIYISPHYSTPVSGRVGRKIENAEMSGKSPEKIKGIRPEYRKYGAYNPPSLSTAVLEHTEDMINGWTPSALWSDKFTELKRDDKNILKNLLEGAIRDEGAEAVAQRLEENATRIKDLAQQILYGESGDKKDGVRDQINEFGEILKGHMLTREEDEIIGDIYYQQHKF